MRGDPNHSGPRVSGIFRKKRLDGTEQHIVAEDIALPQPTQPVVAHTSRALEEVLRGTDGTDKVGSKLVEAYWPVDSCETDDACIAYEMRNIRVRLCDLICEVENTSDAGQVYGMCSDDQVSTEFFSVAIVMREALELCDVLVEQVVKLLFCCLCTLPASTGEDQREAIATRW